MTTSSAVLEKEIEHLKIVLRTMIVWIASSAGSPLSADDASKLIDMLDRRIHE